MSASSIRLPPFARPAFALALVIGVVSAFAGDQPFAAEMRLDVAGFAALKRPWAPATAWLMFPEGAMGGVFGTVIVQWLFGSPLVSAWGGRRYLVFAVGCGIAAHLVVAALGWVGLRGLLGGSGAIDAAVLAGYAWVFGRQRLSLFGVLSLTAQSLAAIVLGISLFQVLVRQAWAEAIALVVAAGVATLLVRKGGGPRRPKKKKRKSHLRVVEPTRLPN